MPSPSDPSPVSPPTSEARHTPGPWKIRKHTGEGEVCSIYGGRDGYVTVFGERSYCGRSDESVYAEVEANARLIAAAPDGHAVIAELLAFNDDMGSPAWTALLAKARAYAAKADGRAE